MLTPMGISTKRMTGEIRLHRCQIGWKRTTGASHGYRGEDHAAADAIIMLFHLPVGPESGYYVGRKGQIGCPYGICRQR